MNYLPPNGERKKSWSGPIISRAHFGNTMLTGGFERIKAAVSFALKSNDALTLADHGGFRRESLWYENAIDII